MNLLFIILNKINVYNEKNACIRKYESIQNFKQLYYYKMISLRKKNYKQYCYQQKYTSGFINKYKY